MADFSAESILEYEEIVRKLFASEDEAFEFYNKYAFDKGFSVRKSYVEWDDAKTEIVLRKLCSRQGFREEKYMAKETKKRRPRDISRVGVKPNWCYCVSIM
jgi:zinc finger SWIM domain-containing protein 3